MTIAIGLLAGVAVLLLASPLLWPATGEPRSSTRRGVLVLLRESLDQGGLPRVQPAAFLVVSAIIGLAASALSFALLPVVPLAVSVGLVATVLPFVVVRHRARARRKQGRVVWPDVVDHLVSAVRSGLALPDSVVSLAHSGPAFSRHAFEEFEANYRATGDFGGSLSRLKDRLADPVADRILETLRMSREVGGSELTLVLRNLAAYLRQEAAILAEVEARQSWVVNAARLGVAAPWIVLLLLATRPEAAAAYNTSAGAVLIVGGLGVSVVAYRLMIGLGRIPEERRWFR